MYYQFYQYNVETITNDSTEANKIKTLNIILLSKIVKLLSNYLEKVLSFSKKISNLVKK
jgi:hypothetical protein